MLTSKILSLWIESWLAPLHGQCKVFAYAKCLCFGNGRIWYVTTLVIEHLSEGEIMALLLSTAAPPKSHTAPFTMNSGEQNAK